MKFLLEEVLCKYLKMECVLTFLELCRKKFSDNVQQLDNTFVGLVFRNGWIDKFCLFKSASLFWKSFFFLNSMQNNMRRKKIGFRWRHLKTQEQFIFLNVVSTTDNGIVIVLQFDIIPHCTNFH